MTTRRITDTDRTEARDRLRTMYPVGARVSVLRTGSTAHGWNVRVLHVSDHDGAPVVDDVSLSVSIATGNRHSGRGVYVGGIGASPVDSIVHALGHVLHGDGAALRSHDV